MCVKREGEGRGKGREGKRGRWVEFESGQVDETLKNTICVCVLVRLCLSVCLSVSLYVC